MSVPHKYFGYIEKGQWRLNDLLAVEQIYSMLNLLEWKREIFASIQTYDENENCLFCPIFFDLDGKPEDVLKDARDLIQTCEFIINVTPRIYFSGNKGFHIIIERVIEHARCHELVADFAKEIAGHIRTLDPKVYRSRSMLRIPGSPASKPGFYKIELTRTELFDLAYDDIRQLATTQRFIQSQHDPSKIDEHVFNAWLVQAINNLPKYDTLESLKNTEHSVTMEMTPCISSMITNAPLPGERNITVFTLAKFLRQCDVDQDTCMAILLGKPHFAQFEEEGREVTKVVRSVYRSARPSFAGCKSSSEFSKLMRSQCQNPCAFREDFKHPKIDFSP